jgi:hypothetical protein
LIHIFCKTCINFSFRNDLSVIHKFTTDQIELIWVKA